MTTHPRSLSHRATCRLFIPFVVTLSLIAPASAQRGATLRDSPKILAAFVEVVAAPSQSTVRVQCDGKDVALGTVIDANGFVLTKSSVLKDNPKCMLNDGRSFGATLVNANRDYDLALLKLNVKDLKPVTWTKSKAVDPGDWVASPGLSANPVAIGIVSVQQRKLPPTHGFMGVVLSEAENGLQVREVSPGSGAAKAKLKPNDVVVEVQGTKIKNRGELLALLEKKLPGEKIRVKLRRGDDELNLEITLGGRPRGIQDSMGSPLSERASGFPFILQHDSVIKPNDCGGPLVDLDGRTVGINIARAGRTESYAIPSDYVLPLIAKLKEKKTDAATSEVPAKVKAAQAKLDVALEEESAAKAAIAAAKTEADKAKANERLAKARAAIAAAREAFAAVKK